MGRSDGWDFAFSGGRICLSWRMQRNVLAWILGVLGVMVMPLLAGGSAARSSFVTVHVETESSDNPKMVFVQAVQGVPRTFRRMPDLSNRDIVAYKRIPAVGGAGSGAVFQLKEAAAKRWQALTTAGVNRWVVTQVNGRVVDGFVIDQPVSDGLIVVWKGLTEADLAVLQKEFPEIGADKAKRKR